MTSSFVLVDQAFGRHTIRDRLSNSESGSGNNFVARSDCSNYFLQIGTGQWNDGWRCVDDVSLTESRFLADLILCQGKTPKTVLRVY